MIVKLTLRVVEDDENQLKEFTFTCSEENEMLLWQADEHADISIWTNNEMTQVNKVDKESLISDTTKEIEEMFLSNLFEQEQIKSSDEFSGVEHEHSDNAVQKDKQADKKPYDPKKIRIDTRPFSVRYLVDLIEAGEIELSPDFQREFVWTDIKRRSRLIESLMLRVPLPAFYLAQDEEGHFKVVDGMQRLTVIHSFINNEFKLKGLEYLTEYDGCWFDKKKKSGDSIPDMYKRRIEQTQLFINIIDPDTPSNVKYDIFKRINTGGKELNAQEIRNSLADDNTRAFINKLSNSNEFLEATNRSIKKTRMADKEIVLRFIAFYLADNFMLDQLSYKGNMDNYLDDTIELINKSKESELRVVEMDFQKSMQNAYIIFGEKAFRRTSYINKALFLALSRLLYRYEKNYIESNKFLIEKRFHEMIKEDEKYIDALSSATNDVEKIKTALAKTKIVLEGKDDKKYNN
ncbi:MAG: DUF262 domain-containing protein [Eubacteriales bacterium]